MYLQSLFVTCLVCVFLYIRHYFSCIFSGNINMFIIRICYRLSTLFFIFHLLIFFFFKLRTAYELRIIDWISDVCSSDLVSEFAVSPAFAGMTIGGDLAVIDGGGPRSPAGSAPLPRRSEIRAAVAAVGLHAVGQVRP